MRMRHVSGVVVGMMVLALLLANGTAMAEDPVFVEGSIPGATQHGYAAFTSFDAANFDAVEVGLAHTPGQYAAYGAADPDVIWGADPNQVTVTYDKRTYALDHPIDGGAGTNTISFGSGDIGVVNYVEVTLTCAADPDGIALNTITINGDAVGSVAGTTAAETVWYLDGVNLVDGFVMQGNIEKTAACEPDGRIDILYGRVPVVTPPGENPPAMWELTSDTGLVDVGDEMTVNVTLSPVVDLFGYQFEIFYDPALLGVSSASFVNSFFDTTSAYKPTGWNADCAAGVCRFAATKVAPDTPITSTETRPIAQIVFEALAAGNSVIGQRDDLLSDADGYEITDNHELPVGYSVVANTTLSGRISLQGRATPIDVGAITVTDISEGGTGRVKSVDFNVADGTYSVTVAALAQGSTFKVEAAHGLYITNETTIANVLPAVAVADLDTTLRGGDANNSARIDIGDLACIGGDFGGAPGTCGGAGSSDINASGLVNIFDLTLTGGNYDLAAPGIW